MQDQLKKLVVWRSVPHLKLHTKWTRVETIERFSPRVYACESWIGNCKHWSNKHQSQWYVMFVVNNGLRLSQMLNNNTYTIEIYQWFCLFTPCVIMNRLLVKICLNNSLVTIYIHMFNKSLNQNATSVNHIQYETGVLVHIFCIVNVQLIIEYKNHIIIEQSVKSNLQLSISLYTMFY